MDKAVALLLVLVYFFIKCVSSIVIYRAIAAGWALSLSFIEWQESGSFSSKLP